MWKDVLDKPIAQSFLDLMNHTFIPYCINRAIWSIKNNLKFPLYGINHTNVLKVFLEIKESR